MRGMNDFEQLSARGFYHWRVEQYERNPFFNFIAAGCLNQKREDHWGVVDLSPTGPC